MKSKLKKVLKYIFRGWEYEPPHPVLKIIPPFVFDIFLFLIVGSIIFTIVIKVFGIEID